MKQLIALNIDELKQWFLNKDKSEILNLPNEEVAFLLETLTPYKDKLFYNNQIRVKLLTQWFEHEETWEEYPVSRKTLFESYRKINGNLPEVTIPTLQLFNYFIGTGYLSQLTTA